MSTFASRDLIIWLQSLDLGSSFKNIKRDFGNGYMIAQILVHYFPKDVHMPAFYSGTSSQAKKNNWEQIEKIIKKKESEFRMDKHILVGAAAGDEQQLLNFLVHLHSVLQNRDKNKLDSTNGIDITKRLIDWITKLLFPHAVIEKPIFAYLNEDVKSANIDQTLLPIFSGLESEDSCSLCLNSLLSSTVSPPADDHFTFYEVSCCFVNIVKSSVKILGLNNAMVIGNLGTLHKDFEVSYDANYHFIDYIVTDKEFQNSEYCLWAISILLKGVEGLLIDKGKFMTYVLNARISKVIKLSIAMSFDIRTKNPRFFLESFIESDLSPTGSISVPLDFLDIKRTLNLEYNFYNFLHAQGDVEQFVGDIINKVEEQVMQWRPNFFNFLLFLSKRNPALASQIVVSHEKLFLLGLAHSITRYPRWLPVLVAIAKRSTPSHDTFKKFLEKDSQKVLFANIQKNIPKLDILSKHRPSDPFIVVYIMEKHPSIASPTFKMVGMTEVKMNDSNPVFSTTICVNYYFELIQILRFEVYDKDDDDLRNLSKHDLIGTIECKMSQLMTSPDSKFQAPIRHRRGQSGDLIVKYEEQKDFNTFIQ
ncbi:hypothetical protein ROZALSC1DRAFT_29945 [Rozella allomycis CSF55]|uniref:C2 domain-containing protein n=1 Tax=Rozella allomycis (strain CSF55) TaxID=988480 RepID=A0A4V1IZK3_ROZAC|nr:hypothetical protein ROZALSC1DRAFT_29945 [Rozella allomycis CSF55]